MTTADIKDVSMTYSSALEIARAIDDKRLDFNGMRDTLDRLVDSLSSEWEGAAQREFLTAYNKLKPKLKTISETMEQYSSEIRKAVSAQQEQELSSAKTFSPIAAGAILGAGTSGTYCPEQSATSTTSTDEHGTLYKASIWGKSAWKCTKAVVKCVKAVGECATVVGLPMAAITALSAADDISSAISDVIYMEYGVYDMVGQTHAVEDMLVEKGQQFGALWGDEEAGETIGRTLYMGVQAVDLLDDTDKMLKSFGSLNTAVTGSTGTSFMWGKTEFDDIINNEYGMSIDTDVLFRRLVKLDPSSDFNILWDAGKAEYKALKSAKEFGEKLASMIAPG